MIRQGASINKKIMHCPWELKEKRLSAHVKLTSQESFVISMEMKCTRDVDKDEIQPQGQFQSVEFDEAFDERLGNERRR